MQSIYACFGAIILLLAITASTEAFLSANGTAYHWSSWSAYDHCNSTCSHAGHASTGSQCRSRTCLDTHNKEMSSTFRCTYTFRRTKHEECRNCTIHCTAAHHEWSVWSNYNTCNSTCTSGHVTAGTRCKTRHCMHVHSDTSSHAVSNHNCGTNDKVCESCSTTCPATWSTWSQWGGCSATCAVGMRFRARHCDNGVTCVGDIIEQEACTKPRCIIKLDGGWDTWSSWNTCSRTCGNGLENRVRHCVNPAPQDGGANCTGASTDFRACLIKECPIPGGWSNYTERPCTVSCGLGVTVFVRSCNNPAPQYGGQDCVGTKTKFAACQNAECVRDGGWSAWTDYSNCTVVCGFGSRVRTRGCTNPPPSAKGQPCAGDEEETLDCDNGDCPPDIRTCSRDQLTQEIGSNINSLVALNSTTLTSDTCPYASRLAQSTEFLGTVCLTIPRDQTKWTLGLKIRDDCDIVPRYVAVASIDNTKTQTSYGILVECYQQKMKLAYHSCDNGIQIQQIDLQQTTTDYHMLLW